MEKQILTFVILNLIVISLAQNIEDEIRYPGIFPDSQYDNVESRTNYLPWLLKKRFQGSRGYSRYIPGYGSYYHPWQMPGRSRGYRYRASRY